MKLLICIINTTKYIAKLTITKMEQDILENLKVLTAQNLLLNRSWIWITHLKDWIYSRFYKLKNTLSFKISKMKKYNNFSSYKSNKSFQVQKILGSLWILFNANKVNRRKEFLLLTNISKSSYKILKTFSNLKPCKNNN